MPSSDPRSRAGLRLAAAAALALLTLPLGAAAQSAEEPPHEAGAIDLTAVRAAVGEPVGPTLDGADLAERTYELADLLRCPVCQGLSVASSPSPTALAMRDEVEYLLSLGYSEDQVTHYFESAYGEFVRLVPKPEGFNLVVWLLPVVFVFGGLTWALLWMRSRTDTQSMSADETDSTDSDVDPALQVLLERVRQEVAEGAGASELEAENES